MAARGDEEHLRLRGIARLAFADEAVTLTDQQITRVQGDGDAVLGVQGGLVVAAVVLVLDVVVDERGFVEELGGEGDFLEVVRERIAAILAESLVGCHGEEGTPAFSITGEPFAGDLFLTTGHGSHDLFDRLGGEPGFHLVVETGEIETPGLVVAGEMEVFPDPVDVDGGVDAVVLQQGHGDRGNRGGLDVGEGALEHGEAGNADDGFDLPGLDQGHDDGRSFGDEDGVTEALGFVLEILDGAEAALFAEETELVEGRGAFVLDPQALRHEEETALVGNLREGLAPHLVVEADGGVVEVGLVALVAEFRKDAAGVDIELLDRHRRHGIRLGDVVPDFTEEGIALGLGLRDVLLRLAETGRRDRHGPGHLDRGEGIDWLGHRRTEEQRGLDRRGKRVGPPASRVSLQQGILPKSRIGARKMTIRDQG